MQKVRGHHCDPEATTAPTACRRTVSGSISLPSPGCFSPFPHGTGSLSVGGEYLGLGDGPPGFRRGSSGPVLLGIPPGRFGFRLRGCHPLCRRYSNGFVYPSRSRVAVPQPRPASRPVWPRPRSLVATEGIAIAFSSSGYLDISVRRVGHATLCVQMTLPCLCRVGSPIRTSPDQSLFGSSPRLFAAYHVLHRLPPPRHPPYALICLTI